MVDPAGLLIYLGALVVVHLALVTAGRRVDEILLPTVGLLGGIGLLLAERLPQDLVTQRLARPSSGLRRSSSPGWSSPSSITVVVAIAVRSDRWLRLYKYTWAAAGLGLLAAHLRARNRRERDSADARARAGERAAVRAAQGDPGGVPRRLPCRRTGSCWPTRACASRAA